MTTTNVAIILLYLLMISLLALSVLWSDRKVLKEELQRARADRDAEFKRNAELRAAAIAEAYAHVETIRSTTTRLHSMTGDVPEVVHSINNKEN